LGHILHSNLTDCADILKRRSVLIGQINDVLCYFGKLSPILKTDLLYSYCSSLYGCEIWDLNSPQLAAIGVTWRKALKRVWQLPYNTHSNVLYSLCGKWSIDDEIYRRNFRFVLSCINSSCSIVNEVSRMCLLTRPAQSIVGKNVLSFFERYNLHFTSAINSVKLLTENMNFRIVCNARNSVIISNIDLNLLLECIFVRDGTFNIIFEQEQQLHSIAKDIIAFICTGDM
jgi:hypothetical protein